MPSPRPPLRNNSLIIQFQKSPVYWTWEVILYQLRKYFEDLAEVEHVSTTEKPPGKKMIHGEVL